MPVSYLGSLTEQVETTSTLSFQEQSSLVVDLKRGLRDPETADDARALLVILRKRRDLLAVIAEEIDKLLAKKQMDTSPEAPVTKKTTRKPTDKTTRSTTASTQKSIDLQKWMLYGAIVGIIIGGMVQIFLHVMSESWALGISIFETVLGVFAGGAGGVFCALLFGLIKKK